MYRKILSLIIALSILIPASIMAVDFEVEFPPPCGIYGTTAGFIPIKIYIDNNDLDRDYFRLPLVIYSPDNKINHIQYPNMSGGYGPHGSILFLNGFEPGGFWESGVQIQEGGWDGYLPDTICFYAENQVTGDNWPQGLGLQEYIDIFLYIQDLAEPYGANRLCIDSADMEDPYNWLWEEPSPPFGGPYCTNITWNCALPPYITNCPQSMITMSYRNSIYRAFEAQDGEYSPIIDWQLYGPGTLTPMGQYVAQYEYTPVFEDYGDTLEVGICAATQWFPCSLGAVSCSFEIYVRAPVCGDANNDAKFDLLDILGIIGVLYSVPPDELDYDPMVVDVNSDGSINLLDILTMIGALYNNPPSQLNCTIE